MTPAQPIHDPLRPQYHFLPARNWMNDPNGLIQWHGRYHLFYQYNPHGPFHGTIHWGHAASDDLVHWSRLPIALAPTPGGPDEEGCWSGCAVDDHGVPTLIYTGVSPETQCIATGTDDLVAWEKYPGNPVIASPPSDLEITDFRDPCVWHDSDQWRMVLGARIEGVGGAVLQYQSPDLRQWDYIGPLLVDDGNAPEQVWECPSFFRLGNKHVLIVSVTSKAYTQYFIGHFRDHQFTPQIRRKLDYGRYFYAPQTFLDEQGRRLMFGWIWEGRTDEAAEAAGWAGVQSVPRILSLRDDDVLSIEPAPELKALRGKQHRLLDVVLDEESSDVLSGVRGDCLEIVAEFEPGDAQEVGLLLRCSPGGEEQTRLSYDWESGQLRIDRSRSSLSKDTDHDTQHAPLTLAAGERLQLHIYLDRSVIEVFANGTACLTSRIYPSRVDSLGLDVYARGGSAKLVSMDVWEMQSIW